MEHLLLCYQLLLWKQCYWLINTRGFTRDLEEIVRNRVWRGFLQVLASEGVLRDSSQRNEQFLSTQSSDGEDTDGQSFPTRKPNQLPRLEDSLAMLYLSCNILRIPIMVDDARRWAFADGFPYVRAEAAIPEQLTTKLPMSYRRTFQSRVSPLSLPSLCSRVTDESDRLAFRTWEDCTRRLCSWLFFFKILEWTFPCRD